MGREPKKKSHTTEKMEKKNNDRAGLGKPDSRNSKDEVGCVVRLDGWGAKVYYKSTKL